MYAIYKLRVSYTKILINSIFKSFFLLPW